MAILLFPAFLDIFLRWHSRPRFGQWMENLFTNPNRTSRVEPGDIQSTAWQKVHASKFYSFPYIHILPSLCYRSQSCTCDTPSRALFCRGKEGHIVNSCSHNSRALNKLSTPVGSNKHNNRFTECLMTRTPLPFAIFLSSARKGFIVSSDTTPSSSWPPHLSF